MDLSWILLALFLIAAITGTVKSLSRSMLKNILRLASVVLAYSITLVMQVLGVFQSAVTSVLELFSTELGYESAVALISGLASTVITPILFVITFFIILVLLRIVVFIVVKIVDELYANKSAEATDTTIPTDATNSAWSSDYTPGVAEPEAKDESEPEAEVETVAEPVAEAELETVAEAETVVDAEISAEANNETSSEAEPSETQTSAESEEDTTADGEPEAVSEPEADETLEPAAIEENAEESTEASADENAEKANTPPVIFTEDYVEERPVSRAASSSDGDLIVIRPTDDEPAPKKRRRIKGIYDECAWRRAVSIATGIIGGVLVLAVMLLPLTYLMSIFSTATDAIEGSDAEDSPIYQAVAIVDDYIVSPYEDSFVSGFYGAFSVSDLLNFTARAGGKIVLEDGEVVYADDVLKGVIYNGISAAAQITSEKSECKDIRNNVNAIISDPMLSTILADLLTEYIAEYETTPPEEGDVMGGLVASFIDYYKNADKAIIRHDLAALADAAGVLAEARIIAQLVSGEVDLEAMLKDGDMLANLLEAISGLSSFGPTVESAFELGINILGQTLMIPENDSAVYDSLIEDILSKMVKTNSAEIDVNAVKYYIYHTEKNGLKANSSNGIAGYGHFSAYVAQWERVQSAFAQASEDRSYGYFTMDINGVLYVYDSSNKSIVRYTEENSEQYKNKISPVSGLINALTLYSSANRLTVENLNTILSAYVASSTDEASVALAGRLLDKSSFVSEAVTIEKLLAATDFTDWTEEEKAADSRLCVDIIMDLLDLVEVFDGGSMDGGVDAALAFVDQFTKLGTTMDTMKKTSCIGELPPLLIEGLIKNEMLADFLKPSIVFQMNDIVKNNDRSYYDCMNQIAVNIRFAINALGGDVI